jgi:hypothetical protein
MRRSALLVLLTFALAGGAQAASRTVGATGGYSYSLDPSFVSFVEIEARLGTVPNGRIEFSNTLGHWLRGPVTCVVVQGSDAWISGPIEAADQWTLDLGVSGWAARLHDGGTPGTKGDLAVTVVDAIEGVEAYCASADPSIDDWMVPVTAGNLLIHASR